jgi:hypothetical protein
MTAVSIGLCFMVSVRRNVRSCPRSALARCVMLSVRRNASYTNHNTQADADRGHDLTFLLTLTITHQANADRGHDLTFLLTLTITPQADADGGHDITFLLTTTVGIGLGC